MGLIECIEKLKRAIRHAQNQLEQNLFFCFYLKYEDHALFLQHDIRDKIDNSVCPEL